MARSSRTVPTQRQYPKCTLVQYSGLRGSLAQFKQGLNRTASGVNPFLWKSLGLRIGGGEGTDSIQSGIFPTRFGGSRSPHQPQRPALKRAGFL